MSLYHPQCGHHGDYVVGQGTDESKYYCAICRIAELEAANHAVAVCQKHTEDIVRGDCVICEIERLTVELLTAKNDLADTEKDADRYAEKWHKTNAENERLRAVYEAAKDWHDWADKHFPDIPYPLEPLYSAIAEVKAAEHE